MIAHNLPRTADGKLPPPIMPGNTSLEFNEMCNANEENQKYFIDRYVEERVQIDFWWMDAGWYPCNGWPQTGTWEPDPETVPQRLAGHQRSRPRPRHQDAGLVRAGARRRAAPGCRRTIPNGSWAAPC